DVVNIIKKSREQNLKCGKDYGLLAYNDIPSYEVIDEGITALTIDWKAMGNEAAAFVLNEYQTTVFLHPVSQCQKGLVKRFAEVLTDIRIIVFFKFTEIK
ncbi:hypothetical protein EZS27_043806, partial [termite gut metagenome]